MEALAERFQRAAVESIAECRRLGYNPTRFAQMVAEHGAVEAAWRLIVCPDPAAGFARLYDLDALHLSVEAMIVQPEFSPLFSPDVRRAARHRLSQVGFAVVS